MKQFQDSAKIIRTVISLQVNQDSTTYSPLEREEEQEEYGSKTAAMPDPTIYSLSQLEELIDMGTLPEHLKEAAWAMLRKQVKAFGFNSHLGSLPARVHIWTMDGQVPITVPMYHTSLQKREIIDDQLNMWFEQGVIEPSKSPWSTPIVIAYCNGKPRFCVDY